MGQCEQTSRSRQSRAVVSAPYRAAISAGSGFTRCWQLLHRTINQTRARVVDFRLLAFPMERTSQTPEPGYPGRVLFLGWAKELSKGQGSASLPKIPPAAFG